MRRQELGGVQSLRVGDDMQVPKRLLLAVCLNGGRSAGRRAFVGNFGGRPVSHAREPSGGESRSEDQDSGFHFHFEHERGVGTTQKMGLDFGTLIRGCS